VGGAAAKNFSRGEKKRDGIGTREPKEEDSERMGSRSHSRWTRQERIRSRHES